MPERVLVTGGSGFIATHCVLKLLNAGYHVRSTVRSLKREADVRAMLRQGGAEPGTALEFVESDLTDDGGWPEATAGCDFVLHVASPLPVRQPRDHDVLVRPAREGALRLLRAARGSGVRRVVLTSSFAAIGYGHRPRAAPLTEDDWTDPERQGAYIKSKTLAERAAWEFVAREGGGLELTTVNPTIVLGPVLDADSSASVMPVKLMLAGWMPFVPRRSVGVVDVRDVADLHLKAMTSPEAKGQRFLCTAGSMSLLEIAQTLKDNLGSAARRVSTSPLPEWVISAAKLFNESARQMADSSGAMNASSEKARSVLGWRPRLSQEAVIATGESLVRLGLIKP